MSTTTTTSNKLLITLDASAFKDSSCLLRVFNTAFIGYRSLLNDNVIEFGTAFHKFKSTFRETGSPELGQIKAHEYFTNTPMRVGYNKDYLTPSFLMKTCMEYATLYTNDNFQVVRHAGKALVEEKFCFPYYVDDEVEVLMAGTIDEIVKIENGIYCITDVKTTSVWKVEEYLASYRLSPQLIFYRWALDKYAEAFPESIIGDICRQTIGCCIDGIFMKGKSAPTIFQRSEVFIYPPELLKEFDQLVGRKVQRIVEAIKIWKDTGVSPAREGILNGSCITVFGQCKYFASCASLMPEVVLENNFSKVPYDPLNFQ